MRLTVFLLYVLLGVRVWTSSNRAQCLTSQYLTNCYWRMSPPTADLQANPRRRKNSETDSEPSKDFVAFASCSPCDQTKAEKYMGGTCRYISRILIPDGMRT